METKLWQIFDNVNRWLEYAEKKNGFIMTLIGLQLTIAKSLIDKPDTLMLIAGGFLGLGFLITVKSFMPKTKIPDWLKLLSMVSEKPDSTNDNLLFYGHIAKYSVDEYCIAIGGCYSEKVKGIKNLEDLCEQIVVNSGIALAKYKFFKIAIWFLLVGQILFFASFYL